MHIVQLSRLYTLSLKFSPTYRLSGLVESEYVFRDIALQDIGDTATLEPDDVGFELEVVADIAHTFITRHKDLLLTSIHHYQLQSNKDIYRGPSHTAFKTSTLFKSRCILW